MTCIRVILVGGGGGGVQLSGLVRVAWPEHAPSQHPLLSASTPPMDRPIETGGVVAREAPAPRVPTFPARAAHARRWSGPRPPVAWPGCAGSVGHVAPGNSVGLGRDIPGRWQWRAGTAPEWLPLSASGDHASDHGASQVRIYLNRPRETEWDGKLPVLKTGKT